MVARMGGAAGGHRRVSAVGPWGRPAGCSRGPRGQACVQAQGHPGTVRMGSGDVTRAPSRGVGGTVQEAVHGVEGCVGTRYVLLSFGLNLKLL